MNMHSGNKTSEIIFAFVILLMTFGYTTNTFSQVTVGNTTILCDPDEKFDTTQNKCVPKQAVSLGETPILCDPDEEFDTTQNKCVPKEPVSVGETPITCDPDEKFDTTLNKCVPKGDAEPTIPGTPVTSETITSSTTTSFMKDNKLIIITILNTTSIIPQ